MFSLSSLLMFFEEMREDGEEGEPAPYREKGGMLRSLGERGGITIYLMFKREREGGEGELLTFSP